VAAGPVFCIMALRLFQSPPLPPMREGREGQVPGRGDQLPAPATLPFCGTRFPGQLAPPTLLTPGGSRAPSAPIPWRGWGTTHTPYWTGGYVLQRGDISGV